VAVKVHMEKKHESTHGESQCKQKRRLEKDMGAKVLNCPQENGGLALVGFRFSSDASLTPLVISLFAPFPVVILSRVSFLTCIFRHLSRLLSQVVLWLLNVHTRKWATAAQPSRIKLK